MDPIKVKELLTGGARKKFEAIERQLTQLGQGGRRWRVAGVAVAICRHSGRSKWDRGREKEPSYILSSGEPDRPEKDKPVEPGWPFAPEKIDFRDGRLEAFADWLTAPENPLFARVAVNRLWQWHFGEGLQKSSSDFGVARRYADQSEASRLAGGGVRRP